MNNKILFSILIPFLFASCTKTVNLKLKNTTPQIVIDGSITNEAGPYIIKISKTVNFSQPNDFPAVTGATVIISTDSGFKDTLRETMSGTYTTSSWTGMPGTAYHLSVMAEGKEYYATSTMPLPVILDSLSFDLFTNSGNTGGKEYLTLPMFTDPAATVNSYQFLQTVNGKLDKSIFVMNDNTFNGLANDRLLFNPDAEIKPGDTVSVEFRCIDRVTYDYFFTISESSSDGPFGTTPTNPPSNITGNKALGIFSAYTLQRVTSVVP